MAFVGQAKPHAGNNLVFTFGEMDDVHIDLLVVSAGIQLLLSMCKYVILCICVGILISGETKNALAQIPRPA
jgi:hypothetical protein